MYGYIFSLLFFNRKSHVPHILKASTGNFELKILFLFFFFIIYLLILLLRKKKKKEIAIYLNKIFQIIFLLPLFFFLFNFYFHEYRNFGFQ